MSQKRCGVTGLLKGEALKSAIRDFVYRKHEGTWIFFVRIDRIEYINAYFGRAEGDATLQRVSEILGRLGSFQLYRFVGPVFVLFLEGTTADALELAERIRKTVADSSEFLERTTVSVAIISADDGDSVEGIETVAYARLQIARRRGGNTVCAVSHTDENLEYSTGTVLIIDPGADALAVLIREIEARGFTVIAVSDGLEGLQVVSQLLPDVIISAMTVPKIGGFELRNRMRQSEELATIPFVLLSHRWNDELIREAAALGILHYYRKPISAVLIAELVRNLTIDRFRETESGCR